MSSRPHGDDWWQDDGGRWWPPESRTPEPSGPRPGPPDTLDPRLTIGTVVALGAAAAASVGSAAALFVESRDFDPATVRSAPTVVGALGPAATAVTIWSLAGAAASVVMIVWMYRAYRASMRRGAIGTSWSPGWAIGGWLLPFANLVIPKLVVNEIDRVTGPRLAEPVGDRWRGQPLLTAGHWWWASMVVSVFLLAWGLGSVAEQIDSISLAEDAYRAGLRTTAIGMALYAAASAAGALVVRELGRRLHGSSRR
jgi:hypothetical protein